MVSYNRIQWERRHLEVSKRNYELDFVTKTYSKKERESEADKKIKAFVNNFNHYNYKLTMRQRSFKIPSETVEI